MSGPYYDADHLNGAAEALYRGISPASEILGDERLRYDRYAALCRRVQHKERYDLRYAGGACHKDDGYGHQEERCGHDIAAVDVVADCAESEPSRYAQNAHRAGESRREDI